eukprot:366432-Chlamydomonas_euryale.AAC.15
MRPGQPSEREGRAACVERGGGSLVIATSQQTSASFRGGVCAGLAGPPPTPSAAHRAAAHFARLEAHAGASLCFDRGGARAGGDAAARQPAGDADQRGRACCTPTYVRPLNARRGRS